MKVFLKNNRIEIIFKYRQEFISLIKTFSGRQYNPLNKSWSIPLVDSRPMLESLASRGFTIEPSLLKAVKADERHEQEVEAMSVMVDTEFDTPLPLFPFQKVGAKFLYDIGSGILGDSPGLGKTIQSLAVCVKAKAQKVLIFTPSAVKWQYAQEIEKFIPGSSVVVVDGSADNRAELWRSESTYYIANYELLLRDLLHIDCREWDVIIADEATKISNALSKTGKAIKKLRAKRRIAMTGTLISNKAQEVWNVADFCNPGIFGNYWGFLSRYCVKNQWGSVYAYRNVDDLARKLKRQMIRRTMADAKIDLPDKIETDVPFEMSIQEKELYKKLKKEVLFEIDKADIDKIKSPMGIQFTMVKMLRLQQLADSMELLGQKVKSSKLEVLKELLTETMEGNNHKAIVFTKFAQMADILERELVEYKPLKVSGSVKEKYQDIINRFNQDDNHKILILTSAGQYGLNIQRASVLFHYDQEWSLAKMIQRTGRAYRYGQKEKVLEYHLLAKGSMDFYIKKMLHDKAKLSDQVLGDTPVDINQIREILTYEG